MSRVSVVICAALTVLFAAPTAQASPELPDLDSLIDDSGPLPETVADLAGTPDLAFTTATGVACRRSHGKVTHNVVCAGEFPGAPPKTRSVALGSVYADGNGPAQFLPTAPDGLLGDPEKVPSRMLPAGHKIVFWDFSPTQSLACGVPTGTELVCLLKASGRGGPVTHGFVIAAPQSSAF